MSNVRRPPKCEDTLLRGTVVPSPSLQQRTHGESALNITLDGRRRLPALCRAANPRIPLPDQSLSLPRCCSCTRRLQRPPALHCPLRSWPRETPGSLSRRGLQWWLGLRLRAWSAMSYSPARCPSNLAVAVRLVSARLGSQCTLQIRRYNVCENGRLTLPSNGRSKGRFAPFGPPLMSNVRRRKCEFHARSSQVSFHH